ncbi:MAG: magnesium chelatase [Saprospiraceae bacterium]|nr:magnesium chelatase [Saprospiraceae bacterium]
MNNSKTLGDLKKSGYVSRSLKEELRENLIKKIKNKEKVFDGILGFDDTVLPDIERAILSRHNILLLGLRGQAKTRIARLLVTLLDEYMPIIGGNELNDDPMNPITRDGIEKVKSLGDKTPIEWVHRDERYVEKLATPDVSIADLIGDVDPIKAATLKLPYSDERVIHFGLVPRSHRSIFVINELPDLQPRIQVSLFNILQEGDLQIRGFKLRLPLDIQFIFTANPEDYTNRGSIITPLKDRIESQILTHYPTTIEVSKEITQQEANLHADQREKIKVFEMHQDLLEFVSFEARESEFVDEKSGVSARLSISGLENLVSTAERRMIMNGDNNTTTRVTDFWGVVPAITGKVELVYEGEQEGPYNVAMHLLSGAIKEIFLETFPAPDELKKGIDRDPYGVIKAWFADGNQIEILNDDNEEEYRKKLDSVVGLSKLIDNQNVDEEHKYPYMELALHGMSELEMISKSFVNNTISFSDPFKGMFDELQDN